MRADAVNGYDEIYLKAAGQFTPPGSVHRHDGTFPIVMALNGAVGRAAGVNMMAWRSSDLRHFNQSWSTLQVSGATLLYVQKEIAGMLSSSTVSK
jgi:hypothetical protein